MDTRIDTDAVKRAYPVAEVLARYGVELRPSGRTLVGRCPLHADGGRPNLHVYPQTASWYCFRCGVGGDVIRLVQLVEGIGFRQAVERLMSNTDPLESAHHRPLKPPKARPVRREAYGPAERACLAAAVELYHNSLLAEPHALDYVRRRGLSHTTLEACQVGYARGDQLVAYLRWRRLPVPAAVRVGLLTRRGREFFAGRVVVPETRRGQPIWLIGRTLEGVPNAPKYLALPGRKPLLGWETAARERRVILTEGVFDLLALRQWRLPGLALMGTSVRAGALQALRRFQRVYLALDHDPAGQAATSELVQALGDRAVPVELPGVKDVAELLPQRDGRAQFLRALRAAEQRVGGNAKRVQLSPHVTRDERRQDNGFLRQ